jgi:hypothetical protein
MTSPNIAFLQEILYFTGFMGVLLTAENPSSQTTHNHTLTVSGCQKTIRLSGHF